LFALVAEEQPVLPLWRALAPILQKRPERRDAGAGPIMMIGVSGFFGSSKPCAG